MKKSYILHQYIYIIFTIDKNIYYFIYFILFSYFDLIIILLFS